MPGALARDTALVLAAATLTGIAAQLSVPLPGTPVPVTGQTFAVLLAGAALGAPRAALAMLTYLLAGIAGLPWFADGQTGTGSPTFGYLLGFVAAATAVGALARRGGDRTPARTAATMLAGTAVLYAIGLPYLMASLDVGLGTALHLGFTPFLAGDALKIVLAAGLLPAAWRLLGARR
nr:biotin transporter BioY [Actinomadura rayongensis]